MAAVVMRQRREEAEAALPCLQLQRPDDEAPTGVVVLELTDRK